MTTWYETFNSVFWIAISASVFGFLALVIKSKCRNFSICWGLLIVERDVDAEVALEEYAMNHNAPVQNLPIAQV